MFTDVHSHVQSIPSTGPSISATRHIPWQLGKVQTLRSHQHVVGLRQATGMEHATVQAGAKGPRSLTNSQSLRLTGENFATAARPILDHIGKLWFNGI